MDSTIPMNGAARMTPAQPDLQLPGEPVPALPRPRDPSESAPPFSAAAMLAGVGFAS